MSLSTDTLRMARFRLTTWRAKIEALLRAVDNLEQGERESLAALHQSLRDRFHSIETAVLQLGRLEAAWSGVGVDLRDSWRELESAYESIASRIEARDGSPATRLTDASTLRDSDGTEHRWPQTDEHS